MNNITVYGNRKDVLDLSKRLQATIPGGRKLSQDEALSLAQLSVAHGLDPFNGEAWIIPGSGLMVGIKGLRKSARRAAKEEDSVFWTDYKLAPASEYNAPDDAVVYECFLRDTVTTQAWSKAVNIMTTAGVPYAEAAEYVGPSPVVIGVGIATPKEKSGMPIHQRAKKRAEADALKQRYDVALGADFSTEDPEIIQAEFIDDGNNGKPRPEAEIKSELGYDFDESDEPPIKQTDDISPEEIYQAVVDAKLSENVHAAKTTLTKYCKTGYGTEEKALAWFRLYRGWKDTEETTAQAAKLANEGNIPK